MADYAKQLDRPVSAMLLAGDNFYVNLPGGVADPQWRTLFEEMYDPKALSCPFYATLGNHDYSEGKDLVELAYARANPASRWKMPARYYRIDLPEDHPLASVVMLDSNREHYTDLAWAAQTRWLEEQLNRKPRPTWLICCAHHPLFSNGLAAQNGVLIRDWGPLLSQYLVDFYVSGHEHNLQHLEIDQRSTSFIICGGGGAHSSPMLNRRLGPFSRAVYGFVHLAVSSTEARVTFVDGAGQVVHAFGRTPEGKVAVINTTESDPGVSKPLEAIQGLYDRIRGAATQPTP